MWRRKKKNKNFTLTAEQEKQIQILDNEEVLRRTNSISTHSNDQGFSEQSHTVQETSQIVRDAIEEYIRESRSNRRYNTTEQQSQPQRSARSTRRSIFSRNNKPNQEENNESTIIKSKPVPEGTSSQVTSQTTYSTDIPIGEYVELLTPIKQQLYIYSNDNKEELNLNGIATPSIIITDEMKEQAQLYKKVDKKLLMHIQSRQIYYWDQTETSMTKTFLPSQLISIYGRASMKELVEPLSRSRYMFLGGHLTPLSWRTETNIHPNHIVAAGILRQVLPPMLFFHEPSTNLTYYFRYAQDLSFPESRLVRFTDNTALGETVITPEIMIPSDSASFSRIMATPRINKAYKIPPKKGCL
jgi:hypothetical protein